MLTRARRAGSVVHPVLVVFSLGLLATSVLFDVVGLVSRQGVWTAVALGDLEAGLAGSAVAGGIALMAVAGTLRGSRGRRLVVARAAQWGAIGIFSVTLASRRMGHAATPGAASVVLATGGLALAVLAAWLSSTLDGRLDGAQGRTARTKPSARW
jgi:uncharacterized membrane protein